MDQHNDVFGLLAKLSAAQRTPQEYDAMLRSLPDSVKRTFVEMDTGLIREHCKRSLRRKLKDNPGLGKLLDAVSVRQIIDQQYINILEDRQKVKAMLGMAPETNATSSFGGFDSAERRKIFHR